jgi:predicted nucleic acid-binding protein
MQKVIISDTSCLILFDNIGELDLLHKLYGSIITTLEVQLEFGKDLPTWFEIKEPLDKNYQSIIESSVDKGEASTIALALEYENCLLIIDDLKGRKFAQKLGISIIGALGVIVDAKLSGIISSIKPIIQKIKETNFRVTEEIEKIMLSKSEEE